MSSTSVVVQSPLCFIGFSCLTMSPAFDHIVNSFYIRSFLLSLFLKLLVVSHFGTCPNNLSFLCISSSANTPSMRLLCITFDALTFYEQTNSQDLPVAMVEQSTFQVNVQFHPMYMKVRYVEVMQSALTWKTKTTCCLSTQTLCTKLPRTSTCKNSYSSASETVRKIRGAYQSKRGETTAVVTMANPDVYAY